MRWFRWMLRQFKMMRCNFMIEWYTQQAGEQAHLKPQERDTELIRYCIAQAQKWRNRRDR